MIKKSSGKGVTVNQIATRGNREFHKQLDRLSMLLRYLRFSICTVEFAAKRWRKSSKTAREWLMELCDIGFAERIAPGVFRIFKSEIKQ